MNDNRTHLYCLIRDNSTGQWFGLARDYSLLIESGMAQSFYQIKSKHSVVETDDAFFPSMFHQVPAWAWFVKATMPRTTWTAYWFNDTQWGAAVANTILSSLDRVEVAAGRCLAA